MGTILFMIGVVISMIVFCTVMAYMIVIFINSDSTIIKLIIAIIAITIPIVLIVVGLNLGVDIQI